MRIFAVLVASTHVCLAACQTSPGGIAASAGRRVAARDPGRDPAHSPGRDPVACIETDTLHALRQRFLGQLHRRGQQSARLSLALRPARRPSPRSSREPHGARQHWAARVAPAVREPAPPREKTASPKEKVAPPREKAAAAKDTAPGNQNIPLRDKAALRDRPEVREKTVMIRDTTAECHARRRVVGDERPSQRRRTTGRRERLDGRGALRLRRALSGHQPRQGCAP